MNSVTCLLLGFSPWQDWSNPVMTFPCPAESQSLLLHNILRDTEKLCPPWKAARLIFINTFVLLLSGVCGSQSGISLLLGLGLVAATCSSEKLCHSDRDIVSNWSLLIYLITHWLLKNYKTPFRKSLHSPLHYIFFYSVTGTFKAVTFLLFMDIFFFPLKQEFNYMAFFCVCFDCDG